ncbi:hypothetical protein M409DRAFT_30175 [Zasmidium cellare ATCC 36951]|uniref:Cytochrome P450 n=1 Tax=Zasmidium cellare ATCC 36951 TaxID=1080233 RepID=A0A6A6C0G9_ZASCE|nr:uncharacterized protein M409DRAFT_30175 [Zasmidium cellare ATCC 36951]KAF2159299.1 hypothetical protein M409DRAFT_30175 [Zasmidium cellare ATCC 36951]
MTTGVQREYVLVHEIPLTVWIFTSILLALTTAIVDKFKSPLAKIPGPFLTKFTVLPIVYHDHIGNRTKWTEELHRKYGPVVRLSPKEVSVSSAASIRDVFTGSAKAGYYPKAPIFNIFQHYGARNAFSSIDSDNHSWRRKIVAGNYAQTAIVAKEAKHGTLWKTVGSFVKMVEREGVNPDEGPAKSMDFLSACRFYAADNITSHLFVEGSHALDGDKEIRRIIEDSAEGPSDVMSYFKMEFETLHSIIKQTKVLILRVLGLEQKSTGRSRPATASGKKVSLEQSKWYGGTPIRHWGWKRFLRTRDALVEAQIDTSLESPVGAKLAANALEGERSNLIPGAPVQDAGIRQLKSPKLDGSMLRFYRNEGCASECMDQFLAGLDTVGDTLAYVLQTLSMPEHRQSQQALIQECSSLGLPREYHEPLSSKKLADVQAAPYVEAVLKETLRAFPASTTAFQRVVPTGGRTLEGHFVSGDTIIGGIPTTINRDVSIFDKFCTFDVEQWLPQRWLDADADTLAEMNRRLWTFGSGGRGCIGRHLAILEMKLLIVGIYSRYSTVIDDETPVQVSKK